MTTPLTEGAPAVLKSCKIYHTEEGMKMIPTKKMIREALENAKSTETAKSCCVVLNSVVCYHRAVRLD